jgi:flagellar FliL protein
MPLNGQNVKRSVIASALSAFLAVTFLSKGAAQPAAKEEAKKAEVGPGPTHDLGSFTVNLAGSESGGFVKAGVVLELSSVEMVEEVTARDPQIKDVVINALGERGMSEISSPEGRSAVKKQILNAVNKFLHKGKVSNVFFTEFVFQ